MLTTTICRGTVSKFCSWLAEASSELQLLSSFFVTTGKLARSLPVFEQSVS
jgi:hypothetical protein